MFEPNAQTLVHAMRPSGCEHSMHNGMLRCVICGRDLLAVRTHTDTCGERCYHILLAAQRAS